MVLGLMLSIMAAAILFLAGNTSNQIASAYADRSQIQATESAVRLVAGWVRTLGAFPASNPNVNIGQVNGIPIHVEIQQNDQEHGLVIATAILAAPTSTEPIRFAPVAKCSLQIIHGQPNTEDTVKTYRCQDSVKVTTFP